MNLKNRLELLVPIIKANFIAGQTTYQEVLHALSQKEAILADARDSLVMHKKNKIGEAAAAALRAKGEQTDPDPLTEDGKKILNQYRLDDRLSREVDNKDILIDFVRTIYEPETTDYTRPYLPDGLYEFIKHYETQLIKDLHISLILKTAKDIENNNDLTPEAIDAAKLELWQRIKNSERETEQKKSESETAATTASTTTTTAEESPSTMLRARKASR